MRFVASLFAFILLACPASADPSDYGRVISFGDSLSDNGNLKAFGVAPPPPYYFGRFSNGPTWVEILSGKGGPAGQSSQQQFWVNLSTLTPLNGGSVNVALGGARADNGPNSNGPIPGVPSQIVAYEGFSALSGQTPFKSTDLVTLLAGANDIFQGFAGAAGAPNPIAGLTTLGVTTAGSVGADLSQIVAGGAKTVLVANLPNIGATPSFVSQGAAASQGGFLVTTAFNQALNANVQGIAAAAPQVNIIQMDLFSMSQVISSNPAAFGFDPALQTKACVLTPGCNLTTAQGFAFWDGVHPTEAVHQLIARYASLLLSTEQTGTAVGALGQIALSTRLDESDILFRRGISPFGQIPGGLYAEIIGQTASFDGKNFATYGNTAFDYSLGGVRVGFDANYGSIAFGSSLAYQTGSMSGKKLNSDLRATQIDAYALTHLSAFFAGVEGGVSLNEYNDLKRVTGFPTVTADGGTRSVDYSFAGTVGAQYHLGALTVTPAARIGYASINVDGFTEAASILALQYSDRNVTTGFWTARVRAAIPLFGSGRATVYGEAGYEGLFATDDSYTAKLAFNTAHAVTIGNSDLEARGLFFKAGIGGYIADDMKLSGEYGLSLQDGKGDIQSGRLRLTIPLGERLSAGD